LVFSGEIRRKCSDRTTATLQRVLKSLAMISSVIEQRARTLRHVFISVNTRPTGTLYGGRVNAFSAECDNDH
jgi:hypothetical protein